MREKLEKIAFEAGQKIIELRNPRLLVETKEGIGNYVTSADLEVQHFVQQRLQELLPEAEFVGEESLKSEEDAAGLRWIVDPIDGTANYVRGLPYSGVSIALAEGNTAIAGAVMNPFTGELYSAQQGKGAFCNGERMYASERPLSQALISVGYTSYSRELTDEMFHLFRALFDSCEDFRSFGAAAPELCQVAAGRTDAYVELRLYPWDYAAASCIITEAGGKLTDMEGNPISLVRASSVLAAGKACYDAVLEICRNSRQA